ncbi:chromosome segregation protein [Ruegeria denitrificans]|uniref:Chromosome segregation protein n=1 Tax=Ruegeria denitrificans TaxID=1715692 RepID=A0A0P1I0W3_9RHOB|nr:chromosome segregation protein SMC [Ruegeria denitrificans]CUJ83506.1 chromosome segregation protein [Ruegeria denitrificans]
MKIRSITLKNVRRFTSATRVDDIGDGLNVLSEPNEFGKSTLFDAIQALFFKPHGSRDKDISSLRPHAGGAPEVTIEIETDEGRYSVFKRWLQKPAAMIHRNGTLIAQADEAEAWISDVLGGDGGGPSGLIWVRQGMTDLTGGSKKEQDAALEARRDLMTSVGEEVEAMTGGRRMDAALARCREELAVYVTSTGRPKTSGPWKEAQERVEMLTEQHETLGSTARDLHEALAERKRARRDLHEMESPEAAEQRRAKLELARKAHSVAERHAEKVDAEARRVEMARLTVDRARTQLDSFRVTLAEQQDAAEKVEVAANEAKSASEALEAQQAIRDAAETTFQTSQSKLKEAEASMALAQRTKAAKEGVERRREMEERIKNAEKMRSAMETAAVAARAGPSAKTLSRLEALSTAHNTALAARDATATKVIARYAEGRDGAIRAGDKALTDGRAHALPRAVRLTIEGVGTLEVRPGEGDQDIDTVDVAAQKLKEALKEAGFDDLEAARAAAAACAEAEQNYREAKAVLASVAPDGIDKLREVLNQIPVLDLDTEALDPDAAETLLENAQDAHEHARLARDTASEKLADDRTEATRAETNLTSFRDRLKRAKDALEKFGEISETDLVEATVAAEKVFKDAQAEYARILRDAPDLTTTKAALSRAESIEAQAKEKIAHLKPLLARLEERIGRSSGDAIEERLTETAEKLETAKETLARIEHEVAVLTRLEEALGTARNEARERYFAPIAKELKPLLHLLWPEAELTWGEESLLPDALVRDGREESIDVLSGGTQEQVALLVRLAFARMLASSGRVAPVILDDALIFTDDDRIERMFDALHRQAGDLQIIVLSCRQRAFGDLGGRALHLLPVTTETAAF